MPDQISSNNRFGLWKKWFWIGIVIAIINVTAGLVYGIALALEKENRKSGIIIIAVAIMWFIFAGYFLGPWLVKSGVLPNYQMLRIN